MRKTSRFTSFLLLRSLSDFKSSRQDHRTVTQKNKKNLKRRMFGPLGRSDDERTGRQRRWGRLMWTKIWSHRYRRILLLRRPQPRPPVSEARDLFCPCFWAASSPSSFSSVCCSDPLSLSLSPWIYRAELRDEVRYDIEEP